MKYQRLDTRDLRRVKKSHQRRALLKRQALADAPYNCASGFDSRRNAGLTKSAEAAISALSLEWLQKNGGAI